MSAQEAAVPLEELASLPEFYQVTASPSGGRIAYYYDGTGRNELYIEDVETGDRRQVTDGNVPRDAGSPIAWGAEGVRIHFHDEEGGDEQYDIRSVNLADGSVETVVEAEGQNVLQDVGDDGRYLLFSSTKSGQMNLHRQDTDTGEEEQLTDYEQPVFTGGFSPDGDRIAYTTNESPNLENKDVYVASVEPHSTDSRPVAGDEADGSDARKLPVGDDGVETVFVEWTPDGSGLLVGDESEDLGRVGIYDLESEEAEWFGTGEYEEVPVGFTPEGDGVVAGRMRECGTVTVVYDRETGEAHELALDEGVANVPGAWGPGTSGNHFVGDGDLLVNYTTPATRKELHRYDLDSDDHEVLLAADYGDVDPDSFVDAEYVTYESTGTDETFDVEGEAYEIEGLLYDAGERPSPAIVMVHGGPHGRSDKSFNLYAQFLVSRGYSVFMPNYRGSTGRGREFKNAVHHDWGGLEQEDVVEAGRWLKGRDWIDEDRVAVFGGSYGGYSSYMQMVKHPERWATGIAWVGITDLPSLMEESMPHFKTILRQQLGDPEENADLWEERSPLTHVENMENPILMVHGVNDPRCPVSQARQFRDALEGMGWEEDEDFVYEELGEEGHGSTDIDQKIRAFRIVADYVDGWL